MLDYVNGFGTSRSNDLITISPSEDVPRHARRLITRRANEEGLRVRFEVSPEAQSIAEAERAQLLEDSEAPERP